MRIIHVKTTQKVTREEAANIIQKGKTFAEVISADAVEKNGRVMTERRPSIRQEDYSQAAPAQASTQKNPKDPKTGKIDEKNQMDCKNTALQRKLNAVFDLIIKDI